MAKLQKLRSSRSEEKLPSTHGKKGLTSMTDYEYNSFDEIDSKDDDNDVLFSRKLLKRFECLTYQCILFFYSLAESM